MYTHPGTAATLNHDRHRDMCAGLGQHRRARQLRDLARAARPGQAAAHRPRRAWRPVLRLRARAHA